jgi:hypothetical protein
MTGMVIAVFETASAADAAVQDLDVARIPSAVIRRGMRDDRTLPDNRSTSGRQSSEATICPRSQWPWTRCTRLPLRES